MKGRGARISPQAPRATAQGRRCREAECEDNEEEQTSAKVIVVFRETMWAGQGIVVFRKHHGAECTLTKGFVFIPARERSENRNREKRGRERGSGSDITSLRALEK